MRNRIGDVFFGKGTFANGLVALFIIGLIALGCTCNDGEFDFGQKKEEPAKVDNKPEDTGDSDDTKSDGEIETLVKETIADFTDAVDDEDFGTFREESTSKDFQRQFTKRKLKREFDSFIKQKSRTVPLLESAQTKEVEFTTEPKEEDEKGQDGKIYRLLKAKGEIATSPVKTIFDFTYVKQDGEWKILVINLQLK